jgi:hypothetical protein
MKTAAALLLALAMACAAGAQSEESDAGQRARIRQWVLNLGSEDLNLRDWATEKLREAGSAALPDLRKASQSSDPEISYRAQRLLAELQEAATPSQTSPAEEAPRVVSVRQDPEGEVTVTLERRGEDGEPVEYEVVARNLAELRRRHPELAQQIGAVPERSSDPADQPLEAIVQDLLGTVKQGLRQLGRRQQGASGRSPLNQLAELLEQAAEDPPEAPPERQELREVPPAHLGIETAAGVLVGEIEPGSRWEEAGIHTHDVLVGVNGAGLSAGRDSLLEEIARGVEEGSLSFEFFRQGRRRTVEVPAHVVPRFR